MPRGYTSEIRQQLLECKQLLLQGEHGVGKTALAIQYANKYSNEYDYIVYFSCSGSMLASLETNEKIKKFVENANSIGEEFFEFFVDKLKSTNGKNLLVVDDVPDRSEFAKYARDLPSSWDWLFTSNVLLDGINTLCPDVLSANEAKDLFRYVIARKLTNDEEQLLEDLIKKLGYHTLSIELVAKVTKEANESIKTIIESLDRNGIALSDVDYPVIPGINRGLNEATLIKHIEHILFGIKKPTAILDDKKASEVLIYVAFVPRLFSTNDILEWLSFSKLGKKELRKILLQLQKYGFISKRQDEESLDEIWNCHYIIKAGIIAYLKPEFIVLKELLGCFATLSNQKSKNKDLLRWLYNTKSTEDIVQTIDRHGKDYGQNKSSLFAVLLNNIGLAYHSKRDYNNAIEYYKKAIDIALKTIGEGHRQTAKHYGNIGLTYILNGQYSEAITSLKKAIEIDLKITGENFQQTPEYYSNLGLAYILNGQYDKAIANLTKAIEIDLATVGENHSQTAEHYGNIGLVYSLNGDHDKAKANLEKAIEIDLKTIGENHWQTAEHYGHLACGNRKYGLSYLKEAIKIDLATIGESHQQTAKHYGNIGLIYSLNGQYEESEYYLKEAIEIDLKTIGKNHLQTAEHYGDIGLSYSLNGQYDKAITRFEEAIEIDLKTIGENHPQTAEHHGNIGLVYGLNGQYDKAIASLTKAIEIDLLTIGKNHPQTAEHYDSLGLIYYLSNKYDNAIECYEKAIKLKLKNPMSMNNLGLMYYLKGEYFTAIGCYKQTDGVEIYNTKIYKTRFFGTYNAAEHNKNNSVKYNNLGLAYYSNKEYDKAERCLRRAYEISDKIFGENSEVRHSIIENYNASRQKSKSRPQYVIKFTSNLFYSVVNIE